MHKHEGVVCPHPLAMGQVNYYFILYHFQRRWMVILVIFGISYLL